ncbi:hypothetical protein LMH73_028225 [Vibrio splendidus]|nr:hypothetical protein [Vibrio splendidus]MCC4883213.1 hypothetical protein [Vibrio splendidus]
MKKLAVNNVKQVSPQAIIQAAKAATFTLENGDTFLGENIPDSAFSSTDITDIIGECDAIDAIMDIVSKHTEVCVLEADITLN